jgi:hypothetical protein
MVRTFVALLIPKEWIDYLAGIERDLSAATSGLSWTKTENLHLTLRFSDLGDSGSGGRASRDTRSRGSHGPARLVAGYAPHLRPRVLWADWPRGREAGPPAPGTNPCARFGP